MRVQILGPLRVGVDGNVRELTGRRPGDVLAILLLRRGSPVPAEALLDLIGGGGPAAPGIVHTWVARLRRQGGPDLVVWGPAGYQVPADLRTDADDFVDAVTEARRLASAGPADAGVLAAYRAALRRWSGGLPYANVRDDLVVAERARLLDLRASVVEEFVGVLIAQPDPASVAEALALARPLSDEYPLRDAPARLTMLAQYHVGRPTDALQTYRDLRRRLHDELGVEPAPATAELHEAILRHDLPPWSASAPGPPRPPTEPTNHPPNRPPPAALTTLIGRAADLAALTGALGTGRRLITLVGPGGVGKTRLLAELGRRLQRDGPPVDFVDLSAAGGADPAELAEAIAGAAGVAARPADPVRGLISVLGDESRIVLLDEAERIADELAVLIDIVLSRCPAVRVVVSSRRPLGLPGELVHPVAPLPGPPPDAGPDQVRAAPAVALLADRLIERGIAVDGDAAADLLARITRRLDGLPLALELAAGQAPGRSLAELAGNLDPLELAGRPDATGRRRDLRGVFGATLDTLDPTRRETFHRLSVFAGPFEIADAQAVLGGSVADAVRDLARDALLQVDHRPAAVTFRMLTVVRDLARTGLDHAAAQALRSRHRARYADPGRHTEPDALADRVARQVENYSEALRTAIADADPDAGFALAGVLADHWRLAGSRRLAVRRLGELLAGGRLDRPRRTEILLARARFLQHLDSAAVLRDTAEAMAALDDPDAGVDAVTFAAVLSVRALEFWHLGDAPAALAAADRAVRLAQGLDRTVPAEAAGLRALIHAVAGDPAAGPIADEARGRLAQVSAGPTRLSAAHHVALALTNLGRFDEAAAVLAGVWSDLPQLAGRTAAPHRYLLTRGWIRLGCADPAAALADFTEGRQRIGVDSADRECAEALLGIGCALAALDAPAAADVLAGAGELMRRLAVPMSAQWRAALDRARDRAGPSAWAVAVEPSDALAREVARRADHRSGVPAG